MDENNFGKGAIKSPKDRRDYTYAGQVGTPFDWSKGFDVEVEIGKKLDVKDQNGSGSCGGQAWSYFGQVLDPDKEEKSAKFIYAQTFVKPAGSYGRTNCQVVKDKGWGSEKLTSSYDNGKPPSEAFMQRPQDITAEAYTHALTDKAFDYVHVPIDVESIAQKIRDNKGVILGICGKNNGTWSSVFPKPPIGNDVWRHWIYAGKAKIVNGKKYIGFLNSWGKNVGLGGWQWIGEEYLTPKYIFETWTLDYDFQKFLFTKTLKLGMKNNDVKELQKRLGLPTILQTGFFGTITLKAVKEYQEKKGLIVDGIVGPATRALLNK